jgi:hypothetical protein
MTILEIKNLKENFDLGPPYDATIDIDYFLSHYVIKKIDVSNLLP